LANRSGTDTTQKRAVVRLASSVSLTIFLQRPRGLGGIDCGPSRANSDQSNRYVNDPRSVSILSETTRHVLFQTCQSPTLKVERWNSPVPKMPSLTTQSDRSFTETDRTSMGLLPTFVAVTRYPFPNSSLRLLAALNCVEQRASQYNTKIARKINDSQFPHRFLGRGMESELACKDALLIGCSLGLRSIGRA
jgi:hypothetical protein